MNRSASTDHRILLALANKRVPLTQEQVAVFCGVSRTAVQQAEKRAMRKLREVLNPK